MFFEIRKFPIFRKFAVFFDKNLFFFPKTLDRYIFPIISVNGPSKMNGHQCQSGWSRTKANGLAFYTGRPWVRAHSMKANDSGRLNVDGLKYGTLTS